MIGKVFYDDERKEYIIQFGQNLIVSGMLFEGQVVEITYKEKE